MLIIAEREVLDAYKNYTNNFLTMMSKSAANKYT